MSEILQALRKEHVSMSRLLNVFEDQISKVESGEGPDYELIEQIADYFSDFPAVCHHPKEDAIYERLVAQAPDRMKVMGDLTEEHEEVTERLESLKHAVRNILLEIEVSKPTFCAVARTFIDNERRHMAMEEGKFFPLAAEILNDEDWTEIGKTLDQRQDPLAVAESEDRFRALRQELVDRSLESD